jgi:hypothetical protein
MTGNILISGNWRKMNAIKSSCQVGGARRGDHCLLRHPRPISGRQGRTPIPPGGKRAMTLFQGAERRTLTHQRTVDSPFTVLSNFHRLVAPENLLHTLVADGEAFGLELFCTPPQGFAAAAHLARAFDGCLLPAIFDQLSDFSARPAKRHCPAQVAIAAALILLHIPDALTNPITFGFRHCAESEREWLAP